MNIARILYQALNPYGTVSIRQYESGNFGGGGGLKIYDPYQFEGL
jgi:hypothetical protein